MRMLEQRAILFTERPSMLILSPVLLRGLRDCE